MSGLVVNHSIVQLPLSLNLRDDAIFDNFFSGSNALVIDALKSFVANGAEQFIYCYGEPGSGRTHLLQACCHLANQYEKTIFYLSLSQHADFSSEILQELEQFQIVCIDDIDAVVGNRIWEEALFHFYNRARDNKTGLLVSAVCAPQQLRCVLPDLQSRLAWGLALEIKNLTDEEKTSALQLRAAFRGLQLSSDVAGYLIHHRSRNMRDLFSLLEKLDYASLIAKRKITIPFVKTVI